MGGNFPNKSISGCINQVNGILLSVAKNKVQTILSQFCLTVFMLVIITVLSYAKAETIRSLTSMPMQVCNAAHVASEDRVNLTHCQPIHFYDIDPQGKELWIQVALSLEPEFLQNNQPLGLYLSAKTASRVYFNGVLVGENGKPAATARDEIAGKMDSVFYLPTSLFQATDNQLSIHMSSHHGYLSLKHPLHFIGLAPYGAANRFFQQYSQFSLMLLGMFILSVIYYLALCVNPQLRKNAFIFLLMSLFAGCQLLAEISRKLTLYSYPDQDLRLLAISGFSLGFGLCLLIFICRKFASQQALHWVYSGILLTLIALFMVPGFDAKTAVATLVPVLVCIILLGLRLKQQYESRIAGYLVVFILFLLTIVATFSYFHELPFYCLVAGLLSYLFVQQAREYSREQQNNQREQLLRTKLEYKIAQSQQQTSPSTLSISNAGAIERISTADILYCQAAGDYVELHCANRRMILFTGSLKILEEQLPATFIRVHRSYLVNLDQVKSLKNDAGKGKLILQNGGDVPVSRRMLPSVRESLTQDSQ